MNNKTQDPIMSHKWLDKTMVISSLFCLIPMIVGLILYNQLPDQLPTHWGANGEIDDYSSKNFTVYMLPLIFIGLNLFTHFILNNDPKRGNASDIARLIGKWTIPAVSVFATILTYGTALGYSLNVSLLTPIFVSIIFIVIGNYLPKCKRNYTVGIRLPWTLDSEANWNKTHRLAGFVWVAGGLFNVLLALIKVNLLYSTAAVITVLVVVPMVYSYQLYRKGI